MVNIQYFSLPLQLIYAKTHTAYDAFQSTKVQDLFKTNDNTL